MSDTTNCKLPSIFSYATSELSQDAFICYLLRWSENNFTDCDESLNRCARELIGRLFNEEIPDEAYDNVKLITQMPIRPSKDSDKLLSIDIVAEIGDRHVLVIEDKKHAMQGKNQLKDYKNGIELRSEYKGKIKAFIYFKTGDQCKPNSVEADGFRHFGRKDLLEILRKYIGANSIINDFYNYWYPIDEEVHKFYQTPVAEWKKNHVIGFYKILENKFNNCSWKYVPNPSGGFQCFSLGAQNAKKSDHNIYLQIEANPKNKGNGRNACELKLVFKVHKSPSPDKSGQKKINKNIQNAIINHSLNSRKNITRPARMSSTGKHMTVCQIDDFVVQNDAGLIDIDKTIAIIESASFILENV